MNCFSELTYSIYADGELPADLVHQVEAHLPVCARCRGLVSALRTESQLLAEVLRATELVPMAAGRQAALGPLWAFLGMVAVSSVVITVVTWITNQVPTASNWLNPFHRTGLLNLLFNAVLYFGREGDSMLHTIITALSVVTLSLLIVGGLVLLFRRRSVTVALLAGLLLGFMLPRSAAAIERRAGAMVTVPSGETVDGSLLATGDTVDIEGIVNGDLITASGRAVIRGVVKGDVIASDQTIDVEGAVGGNVYAFAQALSVRGTVARSIYAWVQSLQLDPAGRVDADITAGAAEVSLNGAVGRDVTFFCGSAQLRGGVGRNVKGHTGNLTLAAPARVGGDLTVHVNNQHEVQIDPGATVRGKTEIRLPEKGPSRYVRPGFYFWQAVWLGAALLIGLVLYWLFPTLFTARLEGAGSLLKLAGIGFLVLVATPIAVLILGITLVGLPIAIVSLAAWLVGLYLAKVFVAALIGQALIGQTTIRPPTRQGGAFALALLVGLFIIFAAVNLPYLGGVISFLVILLGFGIAFRQARNARHRGAPA